MAKLNRQTIGAVILGLLVVAGFMGTLAVSGLALRDLRVNGPTYRRIIAHKDLVADVLPPPLYVTEAYLEATLVLEDPTQLSLHADRLGALHRQYDQRYVFWSQQHLDPQVRVLLLDRSHVQVTRFWDLIEHDLLPAASRGDTAGARAAYNNITQTFNAHRALIDQVVNAAAVVNKEIVADAALRELRLDWLTRFIGFFALAAMAGCVATIMLWIIRPRERLLATIVAALDSSEDRVAVEDKSGRIIYANRAFRDVAGDVTTGPLGSRLKVIFPRVGDAARPRIRVIVKEKGFWRGEVQLEDRSGHRFDYDARLTRTPDDGLLFVGSDISNAKARERRELDLQTRLAQAEKMEALGRLAGGIAHDFNNILGAIRSFGELLAEGLDVGSRRHGYTSRIVAACDRASDLVRQILIFSRAQDAPREVMVVSTLIREVTALVAGKLGSKVTLSANVPPGIVVLANASQMTQVLLNLIVNASDALTDDAGSIRIMTKLFTVNRDQPPQIETTDGDLLLTTDTLKADTLYLRLSVSDTGSGIAPEVAQKIFDPFFTTKDKRRGSGLGLSVVNSVVAAHGGVIALQSRQGVGTTFHIYLPAHESPVRADQGMEPLLTAPGDRKDLRGRERILIVDDEVDMADAFSYSLTNLGYETAPVYSPVEALEVFREEPDAWDVVISDASMPDMNGLDLIRSIKGIRPDVKTILCTGYSDTATEETALAAGVDSYFHKPVDTQTLASAIRRLMSADMTAPAS